jgi:hypothetical protein
MVIDERSPGQDDQDADDVLHQENNVPVIDKILDDELRLPCLNKEAFR